MVPAHLSIQNRARKYKFSLSEYTELSYNSRNNATFEGGARVISGVGTDLVSIGRIEKAIRNPRFFERVYTPAERESMRVLCSERRVERAAGLFAAKEAIAKALGTGFSNFGFSDIEILSDALGKPVARLHGNACGEGRIHVSIAHDAGMASAFAVWETD